MPRTRDPEAPYRLKWHDDKGYRYAFVLRYNEQNKRRKVLLGTLSEDFVFEPNKEYRLMPIEERRKLIFPPTWDISSVTRSDIGSLNPAQEVSIQNPATGDSSEDENQKTESVSGEKEVKGISAKDDEVNNGVDQLAAEDELIMKKVAAVSLDVECICYSCKLYGAVWLLEKIAEQKHLYEDLLRVFDGNLSTVKDILTLSIYTIVEDRSFSRLDRWLDTHKSLSGHRFESDYITRLTQSIKEDHRMKFIKCRIDRQPKNSKGSIDSTTRSGYGKCLADLKWGHNKDRDDLPCTLEAVVYSLSTHEPIYYRRFPGNVPDMNTVRTIMADLKELGITEDSLSFTTDRGYCTKEIMGLFYKLKAPFLMCAKVGQIPVIDCLASIQYNPLGMPLGMKYDKETKLFYAQYDAAEFKTSDDKGEIIVVKDVKVNAYMNIKDRLPDIQKAAERIEKESEYVHSIEAGEVKAPELKSLRAKLKYHRVKADEKTGKLSFFDNDEAQKKEYAQCGFFASCMYKHDFDALTAFHEYKARDEHEKNFFGLKEDENADMQVASSEDGQFGREFIFFVASIILCTLRAGWKETLKAKYKTSYEILDAMETIRFSEFLSGDNHMTTFSTDQISICDAFKIDPPAECLTANAKELWRKSHNPGTPGRKPGSKNKPKI